MTRDERYRRAKRAEKARQAKLTTLLLGGPGDGIRVYDAVPGERFLVNWHGDDYVYDWLDGALVFADERVPSPTALEEIERGFREYAATVSP